MEEQKCFMCFEIKNLDEFYKHSEMSNGHLGICKSCVKERQRIRAKTDKGKLSEKKRNSKQKRKNNIQKTSKNWRDNNPEKYHAQNKLSYAVKTGKIIKKEYCEECGQKEGIIHGHHKDYSKPLDVIWLCVPCHGKRHPKFIKD